MVKLQLKEAYTLHNFPQRTRWTYCVVAKVDVGRDPCRAKESGDTLALVEGRVNIRSYVFEGCDIRVWKLNLDKKRVL